MQESNSVQDFQAAIASLTSNELPAPHAVEDILGSVSPSTPTLTDTNHVMNDQFFFAFLNDNNDQCMIDFDCGQFLVSEEAAEVVPSTPSLNDDVAISNPPPASAAAANGGRELSSSNTLHPYTPMTITDDQTKNYSCTSHTPEDNYRIKGDETAMSPAADELKRKRDNNRESARKSRKRKEEQMAELEETNIRIKYENEHLKASFYSILKENAQLKAIVQEYAQLKASFHNLVRENEQLKHWSIRISGGPNGQSESITGCLRPQQR